MMTQMRKLERGELTITRQTFNLANAVRDVLQVRLGCAMPVRSHALLQDA
jgi:hypothetical protein